MPESTNGGFLKMRLEAASLIPPPGLVRLLNDLGDGENGFGGNPVHNGKSTLEDYLHSCRDMTDPTKLRPEHVPQTVFWVLDEGDEAIGIVRMRHYLNETLLIHGGHIGYYIRSDLRGRGKGKEMLRLALQELKKLGVKRALITTDLDNKASIRIVEHNGGRFADISTDPETGHEFRRFWVDLD